MYVFICVCLCVSARVRTCVPTSVRMCVYNYALIHIVGNPKIELLKEQETMALIFNIKNSRLC